MSQNKIEIVESIDEQYPLVEDSYSCPNCGSHVASNIPLQKTEPMFSLEPDPHYEWQELHKCGSCETLFRITNGT